VRDNLKARLIKIQTIDELNTAQKKQTTQNTAKQNYCGVACYDTQPVNEVFVLVSFSGYVC